jgi:hypothetical protein
MVYVTMQEKYHNAVIVLMNRSVIMGNKYFNARIVVILDLEGASYSVIQPHL